MWIQKNQSAGEKSSQQWCCYFISLVLFSYNLFTVNNPYISSILIRYNMHTSYQYKAYINFKFHHFPSLKPTFNTPLSWSSCQTGFGFWDSTPQPCAPAALHSPPGRLVSPASQRHCADAAAGRLEPRVPRLVGGRGCLGLPQPDQPTNQPSEDGWLQHATSK